MCSSNGSNNSAWTSWQYFTTSNTNRIISDDVETSINLNIYPNPSSGIFNISFISEKLNSFRITITDTYGKVIFNDKSIDFIGEYTRRIDLSKYSKGIYMIRVRTNNKLVDERIILH